MHHSRLRFAYALLLPLVCLSAVCAPRATPLRAAEPGTTSPWKEGKFELLDGDRVAFIGATFVEREPNYGSLELALTIRWPDRNITFRNLGWSGDTVWGEARARFGKISDGYKALVKDTAAAKPTVLILAYGFNEAFKGKEGLDEFVKQYEKVIDDLAGNKIRVALATPYMHRDEGGQLPKPTAHNENVKLYAGAVAELAKRRGCVLIDQLQLLSGSTTTLSGKVRQLSDNGMHLNQLGYEWFAKNWLRSFNLHTAQPTIIVDVNAPSKAESINVKVGEVKKVGNDFTFTAQDELLPGYGYYRERYPITIRNLPAGIYQLLIDGKEIETADAARFGNGTVIGIGPQYDQTEKLLDAIKKKNELFFNRWRPQNETYLFLFRKGEQGNNAVEIPQFDPLIEAAEKEIASLRVPGKYTYTLKKVEKKE